MGKSSDFAYNDSAYMIDKNLIKRIMKSVSRREVGLSDHQIMHPMREWFLSLALASLFLGMAVFLCVKLYWYYSSLEPSSSSDSEAPIVIYRAEEIETALTEFAARKKFHDDLKASLSSVTKLPPTETFPATSTISTTPPTPEDMPAEIADEILIETPKPQVGGQ
jgi:hypothetical protein